MNAMNSFSITGFVCKDAEVKNFEKASVARFGIFVKHTEKKNGQRSPLPPSKASRPGSRTTTRRPSTS